MNFNLWSEILHGWSSNWRTLNPCTIRQKSNEFNFHQNIEEKKPQQEYKQKPSVHDQAFHFTVFGFVNGMELIYTVLDFVCFAHFRALILPIQSISTTISLSLLNKFMSFFFIFRVMRNDNLPCLSIVNLSAFMSLQHC